MFKKIINAVKYGYSMHDSNSMAFMHMIGEMSLIGSITYYRTGRMDYAFALVAVDFGIRTIQSEYINENDTHHHNIKRT